MDTLSKKKRSKVMSAIRSKHTAPEIVVRALLRKKGLHYKLHFGEEKIDIALPMKKIAIFVDGCFWHGCPLHSHIPKSNKAYWVPKLRKNIKRAKEKNKRLKNEGWRIIHIWEHEIKNAEKEITKLKRIFRKNRR